MEPDIADLLASERTVRERGLRVVAIGGGTGLSTLLKGLKGFALTPAEISITPPDTPIIRDLCAVVTVSDDGGSSGRLRKEFNMLPPGDIRNCIVALSEDEALLSRLFQHRFAKGSGLEGHSFGNLFLAALTSITHDFSEAVRLSSEILLTRGHIHPATTSNIELEALMEDGSRVRGETNITASKGRIHELFLVPPNVEPLPQTLDAIARADIISIGPGSLFTSLIPNLLVRGIAEAIVSSPATKVYICNLMTQANESLGLTAADHIRALNRHAHQQIFDYALINRTPVSNELKAKYALEGACQIVADLEAIEALGVIPVLGDYLEEAGVARHNTTRVAADLIQFTTRDAHAERKAQAQAQVKS
ncbi:MAG: gluconeogenesis factor YvcK family protein [Candidatus Sulfotelmatobacter sp.]